MARIFTGVQQAFGAEGCPFGARTAVTVGASTSVAIPVGWWLVECDSHVTVRYTYNYPTGTFVTQIAASGVGIVYSDGFNVEFRGDGTGGTAQRSQILAAD